MVAFLPLEVVYIILRNLPARSIARFRCVCKQWRSLSYDPGFVKEHQQARALSPSLLLFSRGSYSSPAILLYELGDHPKVERCSLDLSSGGHRFRFRISNSLNGLVCVTRFPDGWHQYLLNPFSREVVNLPPATSSRTTSSMVGLGIDSATGAYKLARLFSNEAQSGIRGCELLLVGPHQEWKYVGDTPCGLPWSRQVAVFVKGTLFWLALERHVLAFDLTDHKFRLIQAPEAIPEHSSEVLLESGEDLCFAEYPSSHLHGFLTIWRLEDRVTHIWTKQYDIVLDSVVPNTLCPSIIGIRGHEILLQVLEERERFRTMICSYDLHTKTLHVCRNAVSHRLQFITESLVSPRSLTDAVYN